MEIETQVLNRSIDDLELGIRTYNCLKKANIQTIGDLVQKTESEMMWVKNFGRKSLNELKGILSGLSLSFGMKKPEVLFRTSEEQQQFGRYLALEVVCLQEQEALIKSDRRKILLSKLENPMTESEAIKLLFDYIHDYTIYCAFRDSTQK